MSSRSMSAERQAMEELANTAWPLGMVAVRGPDRVSCKFDELKTRTLTMAMEAIGPEMLEANAGFPERSLEADETLSPLAVHEMETATLLYEVGTRYKVPEEVLLPLVVSAMLHDGGKRNPNDCAAWHGGEWDRATLEYYREKHQVEGEAQLHTHASKQGAHPALWIAKKTARLHHEDVATIADPHLRWIIEKVQEADKAQAVFLDPRKYKQSRLKTEGLAQADPSQIRARLWRPSVCPNYFGIPAGAILDAAIVHMPPQVPTQRFPGS